MVQFTALYESLDLFLFPVSSRKGGPSSLSVPLLYSRVSSSRQIGIGLKGITQSGMTIARPRKRRKEKTDFLSIVLPIGTFHFTDLEEREKEGTRPYKRERDGRRNGRFYLNVALGITTNGLYSSYSIGFQSTWPYFAN